MSAAAPTARRPGGTLERLGAADEGGVRQRPAGRPAGRRANVARLAIEPLGIFELPQLGRGADHDVGVGADAEAPVRAEIGGRIEDAVAEIGLGDRAQAGDRAAARQVARLAAHPCASRGRGTSARSTAAWSRSQRTGRAPDQARQSSTSFVCSATWMWIGPPAASATTSASSLRRHGAQTVRRDADVARRPRCAPAVVDETREGVEIGDEPPLLRPRRRAAEGRVRVEHRQQRQPDAGLSGRGDDAIRHLGRRRIGRAVRRVVQIVELGDARRSPPPASRHRPGRRPPRRRRATSSARSGTSSRARSRTCRAPGPRISGEPRHGALEGVAVQVGERRARRCAWRSSPSRGGAPRSIAAIAPPSIGDSHVGRPALGQKRACGVKGGQAAVSSIHLPSDD